MGFSTIVNCDRRGDHEKAGESRSSIRTAQMIRALLLTLAVANNFADYHRGTCFNYYPVHSPQC
jgi:hypothetical protein